MLCSCPAVDNRLLLAPARSTCQLQHQNLLRLSLVQELNPQLPLPYPFPCPCAQRSRLLPLRLEQGWGAWRLPAEALSPGKSYHLKPQHLRLAQGQTPWRPLPITCPRPCDLRNALLHLRPIQE